MTSYTKVLHITLDALLAARDALQDETCPAPGTEEHASMLRLIKVCNGIVQAANTKSAPSDMAHSMALVGSTRAFQAGAVASKPWTWEK